MDLRDLFNNPQIGDEVIVQGWIRNHRKQKEFGFIDFSDGTTQQHLQVVYDNELKNFEDIQKMLMENKKNTNVQETVERFWDMFIVDALNGNFDRHGGNWGFIKKNNEYRMAPVYDNGSSMYPKLNNDDIINKVINSEDEINERIYKFPTSHIKIKGRKSSYFEVINCLEFEECNKALLRIFPKIDFDKINKLIDSIECINDLRKNFYKIMYKQRYDKILKPAYEKLLN